MLREVTRPDKSCVSFQYDTFGRRIEKSVTSIHSKGVSEGRQQKVIRFLWNGNNLFHEWEEKCTVGRRKTENKVDFKADYILKLEKREEEKAKKEAGQGENIPDNLITWVFQDDFIPRGKITKDGNYSIISDYLGTPVEAYDEEGKKVWERNLDIYGRVKTEEALGEKNLIPFRFQGQYEDEETGLYYNRFRYYSPEEGCYTQHDPIGLAGGNPTIYGYVFNTLGEIDLFGLDVKTGTGRTHVTYIGVKNGLPYVGYASAPSELNLTAQEIVNRRYGGNFKQFGGVAPSPVFFQPDETGKQIARGLEQRYYEIKLSQVEGDITKVANKQNPVGVNNPNKDIYFKQADEYLGKTK